MGIVFDGISKVFPDGTAALHGLDLEFDTGEFIVLLGPSGSGKTTACRVLAGLEQPTGGRILVDGKDVTDLPPRFRGMGMVFQNYALYSHKSVYENIAYPLRVRKIASRRDRQQRPEDGRPACRSAAISAASRASFRAARRSALRSPARWSGSPTSA